MFKWSSNEVTVSHYRLSIHLSLALLFYNNIWQLLNYQNQTKKTFLKFQYSIYHI